MPDALAVNDLRKRYGANDALKGSQVAVGLRSGVSRFKV